MTSYSLQPGSTVVIELTAGERSWPVPSQVLRCHVVALTPSAATYRGAVVFKRPIDFREIPGALDSIPAVNPAAEYAKLNRALKRAGGGAGLNALSATGMRELEAAVRMIESVRDQESAAPFVREMSRLLHVLTKSVESTADSETVVQEITGRLHRLVPSLSVRVVEASHTSTIRSDAVFFRVPHEASGMTDSLVIEFPRQCMLKAWHLQLLEAAAHLIAFTKDALLPQRSDETDTEDDLSDESDSVPSRGWYRLVVRYLDGRLLKGYGRDFLPARGSLDLYSDPDERPASRVTVPFAHLKAVFFVHDFEGNPAHSLDGATTEISGAGRQITVTFMDGEILRGATLNYTQNAPGFFVSPLDTATNNAKIFVLTGAIRHVQFHDAVGGKAAALPAPAIAR